MGRWGSSLHRVVREGQCEKPVFILDLQDEGEPTMSRAERRAFLAKRTENLKAPIWQGTWML